MRMGAPYLTHGKCRFCDWFRTYYTKYSKLLLGLKRSHHRWSLFIADNGHPTLITPSESHLNPAKPVWSWSRLFQDDFDKEDSER